jgi:hypothetical protein
LFAVAFTAHESQAQRRCAQASGGGRAVAIDERLSALRSEPDFSAPLVQRLGRGREVTITGTRRSADGVIFHRVAVTRATRGWVQAEIVISGKPALAFI